MLNHNNFLYPALLGLGLACSTGLNTFLPLLMLAVAAHLHLLGVNLNGSFAWLSSDTALAALGIAAVAEVVADKIPAVDHLLHAGGTVLRPIAGTVAAASVWNHSDPGTAALLGLIIGAPSALGFGTVKTGTRVASSAGTMGFGNPVLSLLEDIMAVGLAAVALVAPWLVPVIVALFLLAAWKLYHAVRKRLPSRQPQPVAQS